MKRRGYRIGILCFKTGNQSAYKKPQVPCPVRMRSNDWEMRMRARILRIGVAKHSNRNYIRAQIPKMLGIISY